MINSLIPARGGSKGIPRKNIVDINGYPLIAYSIIACRKSHNIDRVIVSTEDDEIAEIALSFGAEVLSRPCEYALDTSGDVGFLRHFFDNYKDEEVALMRPTTPLRDIDFVDRSIQVYFENSKDIDSLRTINETSEIPYKVYKLENNLCTGFFKDFQGIKNYSNLPRQVFPTTYQANGHIDIIKKEIVLDNKTYGSKIYGMIGDKISDIDSPWDLEIARAQEKHSEYMKKLLMRRTYDK